MKERPIIMTGESVRAILDGRKVQTRRLAKLPDDIATALADRGDGWSWMFGDGGYGGAVRQHNGGRYSVPLRCPFGGVGDRLWVRETWCEATPSADYHLAGVPEPWRPRDPDGRWAYYAATDSDVVNVDDEDRSPWKSPMFMPRWASRLTLEIVGVKVERVQDIGEEDARAEGAFPEFEVDVATFVKGRALPPSTHVLGYKHRWQEINAKRAPWSSNPFVWALTFRRAP